MMRRAAKLVVLALVAVGCGVRPRRRSCAATAGRCARSRSRPTGRPRSPAASTRPRSAGRSRATRPSRCCGSTTARSTRSRCCPTAASPPPAQDRRVALWAPGADRPATVLSGHEAPVVALAAAPDGALHRLGVVGSHRAPVAARRRRAARARRPPAERQRRRVHARRPRAGERRLRSHPAHLAARRRRADRSRRCRRRSTPSRSRRTARSSPAAPTARSISSRPSGEVRGALAAAETPIIALARLARRRAGRRRRHARLGRDHRSQQRARSTRTLVGPGLPVWSAAFLPDNRTLLTGGTDRMIRRWDARHRRADRRRRGRRRRRSARGLCRRSRRRGVSRLRRLPHAARRREPAAPARRSPAFSAAGSRPCPATAISEALKKLDIVWTPETVAKLFEVGPATYTPGTKMPEQTIGSAEDRAALVKFLEKATK